MLSFNRERFIMLITKQTLQQIIRNRDKLTETSFYHCSGEIEHFINKHYLCYAKKTRDKILNMYKKQLGLI